jgi:ComF family protein
MFDGDPACVNPPSPLESTIRILRGLGPTLPWPRRALDWLAPPRCVACGLPADLGSVDLCACCAGGYPWHQDVVAPFRYEDPVGSGLRALKYSGDLRPGRVLGALLAAHFVRHGVPQALVPVPLHPRRQLERGYNQAELIAREAACWLRIPVLSRVLRRTRETAAQTRLPAAARRANVDGAFEVAPAGARRLARLRPWHIALVDDVCTTGATLRAAEVALRRHGIERIDLRSVAVAQVSENQTPAAGGAGPAAPGAATAVTNPPGFHLTITGPDAGAGIDCRNRPHRDAKASD